MPLSNFRFFAISYLNDWCCDDSRFVSGLSLHRPKNERLKTLQDAAKYYKVSRTLKTLIGEERLDRALSEVDTSAREDKHDERRFDGV